MITKMFGRLMGSTMNAYNDDMVVKNKEEMDPLKDLTEVFEILKEHKLRVNATKCAFWVSSGKFLGHLVTLLGIVANSEKIVAINDLESPKNVEV